MNEPIQPKTEEPEIPKMEPSDVDDELATPLADDDFSTTMLLSQTDNEQESQLAVDQINESSDRHPVSDVITSSQYSITQPRTFSCKSNYIFGSYLLFRVDVVQNWVKLKKQSNSLPLTHRLTAGFRGTEN